MSAFGSAFYSLLRSIRYARWWVICGFSSAFGSAFYPLFNPQIRMSANPHFTRSQWHTGKTISYWPQIMVIPTISTAKIQIWLITHGTTSDQIWLNWAASQLVTQSTRHPVDSSHHHITHHIEEMEAGLKGLYIREITTVIDLLIRYY